MIGNGLFHDALCVTDKPLSDETFTDSADPSGSVGVVAFFALVIWILIVSALP
jgi:hypothetical protein